MNDPLERALEGWMREAGTVEVDEVHQIVRSLRLPDRGGARSRFHSFARLAAVSVIGLGFGAYLLMAMPPIRTGDEAPAPFTPGVEPTPGIEPTPGAEVPTPTPGATLSQPTFPSATTVWLPPWAGDDAPDAVARRTAMPFCGVERQEGQTLPTFVDEAVRSCFLEALRVGRAAEFARIHSTTEGDPIATIYRYEPGIGIVVLIDSTQDDYGTQAWHRMRCERWVEKPNVLFRPVACEAYQVVGPTPSRGLAP